SHRRERYHAAARDITKGACDGSGGVIKKGRGRLARGDSFVEAIPYQPLETPVVELQGFRIQVVFRAKGGIEAFRSDPHSLRQIRDRRSLVSFHPKKSRGLVQRDFAIEGARPSSTTPRHRLALYTGSKFMHRSMYNSIDRDWQAFYHFYIERCIKDER